MKFRQRNFALTICTATALAGCMTESETEAGSQDICDPGKVETLVGMIDPSDQQIMKATDATAVRRVNEGQPMTMELLPYRATVITDVDSGEVVQANCS